MLVLNRLLNQSIIIDESVEVYVVGLSPVSVELVVLGLPGESYRQITLQTGEVVNVLRDVSVMLINTRNGKAQLGVEAPRETSIHRGQLSG